MECVESPEELTSKLAEALKNHKPAIICLGNELRGDDSVGVHIHRKLLAEEVGNTALCEDDLVICLYDVVVERGPTALIIVDSVETAQKPGTIVVSELDEVEEQPHQLSTHRLPLTTAVKLVEEITKQRFKTLVVGIQPSTTDLQQPMSEEVMRAAEAVVSALKGLQKVLGDLPGGDLRRPHM